MWRDEEIRGGRVNKPSFAALSATVLIHVDKSKLARFAATSSIFSCPTLTLILMISVFRSSGAFLGVFFIDGIPSLVHNVTTCALTETYDLTETHSILVGGSKCQLGQIVNTSSLRFHLTLLFAPTARKKN